jgi:hypothetical protein
MNPAAALWRTLVGRLIGAGLLATVGLVVAAQLLAQVAASGHTLFHASFAIVVLALGGVIIARWPAAGAASLAPAVGCLLMGLLQLVEGIGALGYGVDGYSRQSGLAGLHDLGLAITPIGLVGIVLGLGVTVVRLAGRWRGPGLGSGG